MKMRAPATGFTGRHMLLTMLGFFGVIIGVNVTMAVFARSSWTGLVVENTYVASQQFNTKIAETRAQAALGWKGAFALREHRASYTLRDRDGRFIELSGVTLTFKRPMDGRQDQRFVLERDAGSAYATPLTVADGVWLVEIEADAGGDRPFREVLRIHVAQGQWP